MDAYEATKTVMSRIQTLDPDNVSKIMGYILIQDQGDKEMIRLAFSPDALLLSYINQAKARFGLPTNSSSPNPSPPLSHPVMPNSPSFPHEPPRIMIPNGNGGFHLARPRPRPIPYAGGVLDNTDFGNEYHQFPFLDNPGMDPIMSPDGRSDSLVFPYREDVNGGVLSSQAHHHLLHKRSCSVNDAAFLSTLEEEGGLMCRPCMYFARGFCKNGGACKFLHGSDGGGVDPIDTGSPSRSLSGFNELLRIKALQQQKLTFIASGDHHPFAYNRCMDSLNENPRFKPDGSDMSPFGFSSSANAVARQIYLTFPADSAFREEDVSNYFSNYGPVQDVRIPYQQKRMFGFVTFVYPETVKLILAKGNPHFVRDSRVLVKPYKEKGKFKEKKHQQQQCLSPSGVDSVEHFDTPFGPRMMLSPREIMMRRKLEEEAEMQHAIELQGRRMMNLKLMDLKNENHNLHYLPNFPYSSPRHSQFLINQHLTNSSNSINQENSYEFDGCQESADENKVPEGTVFLGNNNIDGGDQLYRGNSNESDLHDSFEHVLPDNLFSSPTKFAAENHSGFSLSLSEANEAAQPISSSSNDPLLSDSSPLTIASLKSCYLQMPRFSSGQ